MAAAALAVPFDERGDQLDCRGRGGAALEAASHVDTVFVDKTGTLTSGKPQLVAIEPQRGVTENDLLQYAAAIELGSEHPVAHAVVTAARERGLPELLTTGFVATPAMGVQARIDGQLARVGKVAWLRASGVAVGGAEQVAETMAQRGQTPIPMSTKRRNYLANLRAVTEDPLSAEEMAAIAAVDQNCRLIKGQVFLWKDGQEWTDLWDVAGVVTPP